MILSDIFKNIVDVSKMTTSEFWNGLNKMHKEKYNRYSNGSFGGARKK